MQYLLPPATQAVGPASSTWPLVPALLCRAASRPFHASAGLEVRVNPWPTAAALLEMAGAPRLQLTLETV